MWWLCIEADTTRQIGGEEVDLDWFVGQQEPKIQLDRQLPVHAGDEVCLWERTFARMSGLARATRAPYLFQSRSWWLPVSVDLDATRRLRARPLRQEDVVLRSAPLPAGGPKDPWLHRMHESDTATVRRHLAARGIR
jgi:hypothetical protein